MDLVKAALWQIETDLGRSLTIAALAERLGVSSFHLARAFASATGLSPRRYIRRRRLSLAAEQIAASEERLLDVAIDAGYSSQEAFTRAFKSEFGVTPGTVSRAGTIDGLALQGPITLRRRASEVEPPRVEYFPATVIAGLQRTYSLDEIGQIPGQWSAFMDRLACIPGATDWDSYGVCTGDSLSNSRIRYLAGIGRSRLKMTPAGLTSATIPGREYLVFVHRGPAATLTDTISEIWRHWLLEADVQVAEAPDFERYRGPYDPEDPDGQIDVFVPLASECRVSA